MMLELFGGAALGVLFDQFQKEIWRVKDDFVMFKPKLEELEETLPLLYPVIEEIEELNRRLNRPNHGTETIILRKLLEDGTKLVSKCSKIPRWNILKQGRYRGKLVELDNKILRFHNLYLQAHMGRDQKQTLLFVQETRQMMITSLNQQGFSNLTMGFTDSSDLTTASSTGSSNITVGITASSTGSYFKIVIKVEMHCQKCRSKALVVAARMDALVKELMALELVGGAVLGVLFDQLQKEIWRVKDNFVMFKPKLEELEETLTVLYPVIEEIEELNRRLNRPNHGRETIILRKLLEDGTKLVSKCSKIPRWDFFKQGRYRGKLGKLVELDNKIVRSYILYGQAHMGRDQKQTLLFVQETRQMMIMSLNEQGFSNLTMGFTDSSDLTTASSTRSPIIIVAIAISLVLIEV